MPELQNRITTEEAALVRLLARGGDPSATTGDSGGRVWLPVEVVDATGKAACRECGAKIAKGERAISFGFDLYGNQGWGRLAAAYLHPECPSA